MTSGIGRAGLAGTKGRNPLIGTDKGIFGRLIIL